MKWQGWLGLALLVGSGCATTLERDVHALPRATNRPVPSGADQAPAPNFSPGTVISTPTPLDEPVTPTRLVDEPPASPPIPIAVPDPAPPRLVAEPPKPAEPPLPVANLESASDYTPMAVDVPVRPVEIVEKAIEPITPAEKAVWTSEVPEKKALPDPQPRPKGRPVASVGDEVITLPELTEAVKNRLETLGPGVNPSRKQMITMARSILKAMIVRSLVFQEAEAKLGGPVALSETKARLLREWDERERPALYRRDRIASDAEFAAKLAKTYATPDSVREEFLVRSLAAELIRQERSTDSFETYLDVITRRRPVKSIMTASELAAAGRKAGEDHGLVSNSPSHAMAR